MTIENLQALCKTFPGVSEDVKWGHDLCFCVGGKMFLVVGLDESPTTASFKVTDEAFEEMCGREGFGPAPYLARHKWVHADNLNRLKTGEWEAMARQSYMLVKAKLPAKVRDSLNSQEHGETAD